MQLRIVADVDVFDSLPPEREYFEALERIGGIKIRKETFSDVLGDS